MAVKNNIHGAYRYWRWRFVAMNMFKGTLFAGDVGSCQRGKRLEWFRLGPPSPGRFGARFKDSAVFFLIGKAPDSARLMIWQEGAQSIGKSGRFMNIGDLPGWLL